MRLKSLQLIGFKSFVDKTEFNLEKGITCIVGPNGSGKSNIVDAIKWALGEMRPKSLRGEDMEDVVFNGSESRKPSGMAEVSLTFTADGKGMPAGYAEYDELMITRRIFRTGESEYFINKVPVRWRDIIDLFLDTGAGPRAYSIIEQGVVEKIIMAKPDERRLFFEEAAGISKYRLRKKEALADMEATQANLQRVEDVMAELRRQLNSLDRQAKKAEKYRELMKELRENEFKLLLLQYRKSREMLKKMEDELTQLKDRETALNSELSQLLAKYNETKIAIIDAEKRFNDANTAYFNIQSEIQKKDNEITLLKKDISNAETNKNTLILEKEKLEAERNRLQEENILRENTLRELKATLSVKELQEQSLLREYNELQEKSTRLKKEIEEIRNRIADSKAEEARLRNELVALEKDIDDRSRRVEKLDQEIMEIKQKIGTADAGFKRSIDTRNNMMKEIEILKESINRTIEELNKFRDEYTRRMDNLKNLREQLVDLKSRYTTQKEMIDGYEEFSRGVRVLMERQKSTGGISKFVTVADILSVDSRYTNALEAVLEEKLQYIITGEKELCFEALHYLKETKGGRATFILKRNIPESSAAEEEDKNPVDNNLIPLLNFVKCDNEYAPVVRFLLKNVYVVDDLKTVQELYGNDKRGLTFVTPDGDVFMQNGIVAGGSKEILEEGILKRREEIIAIEREIAAKEEELKTLEINCNTISEEIAELEASLNNNETILREKEIALLNVNNEIKSLGEDVENYTTSKDAKEAEKNILEHELKQFRSAHIEKMKMLQERENSSAELINSLATLDMENKNIDTKITELNNELMSFKAEIASLREKLKATETFCLNISKQITALEDRIVSRHKEIDTISEFLKSAEVKVGELEAQLKDHLSLVATLEEEVKKTRDNYNGLIESSTGMEKEIETKRALLEELKGQLTSLNISISEQKMTGEYLRSTAIDKCQKDPEEFKDTAITEVEEELENKINELQERLNGMGEINLVAAEEYRELSERYNFLNAQREDLMKSLNNLREAINKINRTSREKFIETFHAINAKFKEVFPKFFEGGRAELYLTDEHEVLESGIEIFAQPPGKKLQNISLLSGGEKALTGIALIFSFFLNKPSPFCILDEADAPLDEANLKRFLSMVKELNKDIQFIMITHNKLTMEIADALYGITMEEPGVSKVISVRLN